MLKVAAASFLLCAFLPAQTQVFDKDFRRDWATSREFTLAVADAMPVEKYGFKTSDEEMTFAALMIHIATSNAFRFAQISGKPNPVHVPGTIPKEQAKEIAKKLLAERSEVTGRELVLGMFVHTAHHRGQAEVYLRANGIKPPDYRF
jgi:hypothetical protein